VFVVAVFVPLLQLVAEEQDCGKQLFFFIATGLPEDASQQDEPEHHGAPYFNDAQVQGMQHASGQATVRAEAKSAAK
jgi:hypothetical protein